MIHTTEVYIHVNEVPGTQVFFNIGHNIVLPFGLLARDGYHVYILQVNLIKELCRVFLENSLIFLSQVPGKNRDVEVFLPVLGVGH